jgi:hypothetical protein
MPTRNRNTARQVMRRGTSGRISDAGQNAVNVAFQRFSENERRAGRKVSSKDASRILRELQDTVRRQEARARLG